MSAGELNKLLTIQQSTEVTNTYGEITSTWSTLVQLWGSISPAASGEKFDGKSIDTVATHRIKTRYYEGITAKMRVVWNSRTFDINSVVIENERNRYLNLVCTEND